MVFLRSGLNTDLAVTLCEEDIILRLPQASDYAPWAELRSQSRDFLVPWEPKWSRNELSKSAYRQRLRHYMKNVKDGCGYAFFIFKKSDDSFIGGININNIRRGVTQSCSVGYWIGVPYANQGYMTKGLNRVIHFVFDSLKLHRLEAACLPENKASIRLLEKKGFRVEGLARQYLFINGLWQDHILYALLEEDLKGINKIA
ncbi:MAG: GNAT family protein [Pseudomonadota bacterium]